MGKGSGRGKANMALCAGGGCVSCIGITLLIVGMVMSGLTTAVLSIVPKAAEDAFKESLVLKECTNAKADGDCDNGQFDTKYTSDMTISFFSIDNLYEVQTAGAKYELSETSVTMSVTTVAYDLDWDTYADEGVVTWRRQANYSFDATNQAIAEETDIYQVNPVFVAALGQKGGYESNVFFMKSYFIMKNVMGFYMGDCMSCLPTVFKYQVGGAWIDFVHQEFKNMTVEMGLLPWTDELGQAQWASYGYTIAMTLCAEVSDGVYYGYCAVEDMMWYFMDAQVQADTGGYYSCWDGTGTQGDYELDCSNPFLAGWEGGSTDSDTLAATTLGTDLYGNDQVAYVFNTTEEYSIHAGFTTWLAATECMIRDFGDDFTAYETFSTGYAAYEAYQAAAGNLDALTSCEAAVMAVVFMSGPLSYPQTGEMGMDTTTGAAQTAAYHTVMTILQEAAYYHDGAIDFAQVSLSEDVPASQISYIAAPNAYGWGYCLATYGSGAECGMGWHGLSLIQWSNGMPLTVMAGTGASVATALGPNTALQVPTEISVATSYFNSVPTNPLEVMFGAAPEYMDYQGCSSTYNGCDIVNTTDPVQAANFLLMAANDTLNQCVYKAHGLYSQFQEYGYPCSPYDAVTGAGATSYTANSYEAHVCALTYTDQFMDYTNIPPGASASMDGMRAAVDAEYGFQLINPACQYTLENAPWGTAGNTGITWDNIAPVVNYLHKWIGAEFFLKGSVVGTSTTNELYPAFPYVGLDESMGGVGTANSGLFTKRSIMEMISGYNDTLKGELTSSAWYEGLYGVSHRKFVKPQDKACDYSTHGDECDRYGIYTGAVDVKDVGKRYYSQGATEIVTREDIDQECEQLAYPHREMWPYQVHFPDADGVSVGYQSCNVWNTPEIIKKNGGMALEPQYEDFLTGSVSGGDLARNKDDYQSPQLAFYNSLNARVMNLSSVGSEDVKGVFAFKYELDDAMWLNDGTYDDTSKNGNNKKYRHTGPNYLMELTSQHGVPIYLSKPYLDGVEDDLKAHIQTNAGYVEGEDYESSMYAEPLSGKVIKASIKLQTNLGLHNQMMDTTTFYDLAMSNAFAPAQWEGTGFETTIVPFFYITAEAELTDEQAKDVTDLFKAVDDGLKIAFGLLGLFTALFIVGIVVTVIGCLCVGGGAAMGGGGGVAPEK